MFTIRASTSLWSQPQGYSSSRRLPIGQRVYFFDKMYLKTRREIFTHIQRCPSNTRMRSTTTTKPKPPVG